MIRVDKNKKNMLGTSTVKKLQNKSIKALNMFKETRDNLLMVNEEILVEEGRRTEQIKVLMAENEELLQTSSINTKIMGKIDEFINVD